MSRNALLGAVLTVLLVGLGSISAATYTVPVSFDKDGNLVVPSRTPPSGGLDAKDHVTWKADRDCHLNVDIDDPDSSNVGDHWSKPDDHGHSNTADVDTPKKHLGGDRPYKYTIDVQCDSGNSGHLDPELVVAGGGLKGPRGRKMTMTLRSPVETITITATETTASVDRPSVTLHSDQRAHWHVKTGKVRTIHFIDPSAGDVDCSRNDCERGVSDLSAGHYKYDIVVVDSKGGDHIVDPELVVAGGGRPGKHKRLAKR